MVLIRPDMKRERLETQLTISKMHAPESAIASACPGRAGGGHLGIFWAGMCRPGLQIGTPFSKKKNPPKIDTPF